MAAQHLGAHDLIEQSRQRTGQASKKSGHHKAHVADAARVMAHERHTHRVVTHRVEQPAQRGAGQAPHQSERCSGIGQHQQVHLPGRPQAQATTGRAGGAVGRDPCLAAEDAGQHLCNGPGQLAQAQRDHGKHHGRIMARGQPAQRPSQCGNRQGGQQGHQGHGPGGARLDGAHAVNGHKSAQTAVERMAKADHATLPHQQPKTQAQDDRNAHLAEQAQRLAAQHRGGQQQGRSQCPSRLHAR